MSGTGSSNDGTVTPNQFAQISDVLVGLTHEEKELMARLVDLAVERNGLSGRRTVAAELRTTLAQERTKLAQEQTGFSHESTELAQRRTALSEQRTQWASQRTDLANTRNALAQERTALSTSRTELAQERNTLASERTGLSSYRSILARGRTELALIRTGLAFITFGIVMMRYFGLGYWTLLDGSLVLIGGASSIVGLRSFITTVRQKRYFDRKLRRLSTPPLAVEND